MIKTCGAIIREEDRFLLVKQAKQNKGKWNLPGDHVDEGESPREAIMREVKEELSIIIKIEGLATSYCDEGAEIYIFKSKVASGDIKLQEDELLEFRWFTMKEFKKLPDELLRRPMLRLILNEQF
ncbi:NUDIX hydrolase [Candidatus Woesearchaeota archaeon]|nr:NUDIX hydrolase [Candidatus Woesearchaeota archaeon]